MRGRGWKVACLAGFVALHGCAEEATPSLPLSPSPSSMQDGQAGSGVDRRSEGRASQGCEAGEVAVRVGDFDSNYAVIDTPLQWETKTSMHDEGKAAFLTLVRDTVPLICGSRLINGVAEGGSPSRIDTIHYFFVPLSWPSRSPEGEVEGVVPRGVMTLIDMPWLRVNRNAAGGKDVIVLVTVKQFLLDQTGSDSNGNHSRPIRMTYRYEYYNSARRYFLAVTKDGLDPADGDEFGFDSVESIPKELLLLFSRSYGPVFTDSSGRIVSSVVDHYGSQLIIDYTRQTIEYHHSVLSEVLDP